MASVSVVIWLRHYYYRTNIQWISIFRHKWSFLLKMIPWYLILPIFIVFFTNSGSIDVIGSKCITCTYVNIIEVLILRLYMIYVSCYSWNFLILVSRPKLTGGLGDFSWVSFGEFYALFFIIKKEAFPLLWCK